MNEQDAIAAASSQFGLSQVRPLSRGGQKLVLKANLGGREVVLKVVLLGHTTDPSALERCEREVSLLASLSSDHLVKVLSSLIQIGTPVAAVAWLEEYLDGTDLSTLVSSPATEQECLQMISDVASGLSVMHANGYVHRDLSPGNIRRRTNGRWVVMDPGFAKHLNRTSITGVWQPGTLGHLSPEHAVLGGRVTPASDIYCLGILGYQYLASSLPIPVGGDLDDYRRRLIGSQPPSVERLRPDLPPGLVGLIDACLERQPARRILNGTELLERVRAVGGK